MAQVIIQNARLSFPDLFEAVQYQGQGPYNYRASFLMEPSSKAKKDIDGAIKLVATEKWGAKTSAILPGILANPQKCCFIDGNLKEYAGYAGNWALTATRGQESGAPLTIDRNKTPLTAKDGRLYAGCYVNAKIELWAQDNSFGKAIRATLVAVQFVKDGESFGGATPATADGLEDLGFDEEDLDV